MKRKLTAIVLLCFATLLLAGCGSNEPKYENKIDQLSNGLSYDSIKKIMGSEGKIVFIEEQGKIKPKVCVWNNDKLEGDTVACLMIIDQYGNYSLSEKSTDVEKIKKLAGILKGNNRINDYVSLSCNDFVDGLNAYFAVLGLDKFEPKGNKPSDVGVCWFYESGDYKLTLTSKDSKDTDISAISLSEDMAKSIDKKNLDKFPTISLALASYVNNYDSIDIMAVGIHDVYLSGVKLGAYEVLFNNDFYRHAITNELNTLTIYTNPDAKNMMVKKEEAKPVEPAKVEPTNAAQAVNEEAVYNYLMKLFDSPKNPTKRKTIGNEGLDPASDKYQQISIDWADECDAYDEKCVQETAKKFGITTDKVNAIYYDKM